MRFRQGGLIGHPEDYKDEKLPEKNINIIGKKLWDH